MGSTDLHEPAAELSKGIREMHRAIVSLMEELEAIDWYAQRIDASDDEELKAVLAHNRDEEKEHAAMTLEWIRRRDPTFDAQLREYLFRTGPIVGEHHEEHAPEPSEPRGRPAGDGGDRGLGIGSLRALEREKQSQGEEVSA